MTDAVSLARLNRRRCLRIGQALLDGPTAIFPPAEIDDYGWLEAEFRLTIKWPGLNRRESLHVFCDDSMNRDDNFLPPMIRRCVWDRSSDLTSPGPWPSATIEIGYVRNHARVDGLLRLVHRNISALPFAELGLSLKRDSVDIPTDYSEPEFGIWARNGMQFLEYRSQPVPATSLGLSYCELHSDLLAELEPLAATGWRERYDHDLRQEPRDGWECEPGFDGTLA